MVLLIIYWEFGFFKDSINTDILKKVNEFQKNEKFVNKSTAKEIYENYKYKPILKKNSFL